jgi:lipoprotein-anchoring transpeptidase ErfK/SrfK
MPPETRVLDGALFAQHPGTLYVPIRDLGARLDWPVRWEAGTRTLYLNHEKVPDNERRSLPDGTQVLPVRSLEQRGVAVTWDARKRMARIAHDGDAFWVRAGGETVSDGVTFADDPGTLYVPVRALGQSLGWRVHWEAGTETLYLGDKKVPEQQVRRLPDGTRLVAVRVLEDWGAGVTWQDEHQAARVAQEGHTLWVRDGEKRVAVNRDAQQMRAWQGDLLVLDTRVSTGRAGMPTPTGSFTAGPLKTPLLISREYGNARMPWSVQVQGDYVIHGFHTVPPRAASHGCVRVPLAGANPAQWFYNWVEVGTPILVKDGWPEDAPAAS